jgi:hypothetical protein
MDSRTRERVDDWEETPCAAGLDGLRDLADQEFSGVVTGGGTWAFVLNGRIVGLSGGDLDDLDGLPLTAYEAPDPALPLLFAMQEKGGETQAQYYTNDTPIAEAKETLSDGSFTGYIELSENVLSGDYYVCFYGGRALPVAFIGSSERLKTGDEAFERANDEVGIYEVKAVDIEVTELPDPEGEDVAGAAGSADAAGAAVSEEADEGKERTDESTSGGPGGSLDEEADDDRATGTTEPDGPTDEAATAPGDEERTEVEETERVTADSPTEATTDETGSGTEAASRSEGTSGTDSKDAPDGSPDEGRADTGEDRSTEQTGQGSATAPRDAREEATVTPESADSGSRESADRNRDSRDDRDQESEPRRSAARRNEGRPRESAEPRSPPEGRPERAGGRSDQRGTEPDAEDEPRFEREAEWRETRRIPSIDPDRSEDPDESTNAAGANGRQTPDRPKPDRPSNGQSRERPDRGRSGGQAGRPDRGSPAGGSIEKPHEQETLEREDEIDRLQQRVSDLEEKRKTLESERDELEREKESVEEENERLRNRVEELEDEIVALESQIEDLEATLESDAAGSAGETSGGSREMSATQALSATNLFLRYDSKGQATLEDVHAGDADAEALNANLRLEHHTNFDATNVAVDGTPYDQFLKESIHFEFVEWLLRDLPFEIRNTGNAKTMDELFDAIPKIDRVECMGTVEIPTDDDDDGVLERDFDVVARDRMGNPLIIANLNDSLDAATENMMVSLQESATAVKEAHDDLGAAFMLTTSFFDPGALEVAAEATSGSLLSRDSRKSFVKLSRKRGYHLCLVETREGNFHVNVPEL